MQKSSRASASLKMLNKEMIAIYDSSFYKCCGGQTCEKSVQKAFLIRFIPWLCTEWPLFRSCKSLKAIQSEFRKRIPLNYLTIDCFLCVHTRLTSPSQYKETNATNIPVYTTIKQSMGFDKMHNLPLLPTIEAQSR